MNKVQNFVIWLDGYLEAVGDEVNDTNTNVIRKKLNAIFEHEVDKVIEKPTLQKLGKEHGFDVYEGLPDYEHQPSNGLGEDNVLYRC